MTNALIDRESESNKLSPDILQNSCCAAAMKHGHGDMLHVCARLRSAGGRIIMIAISIPSND